MKSKVLLSSLLLVSLGYALAQESKPTPASAPMDDPLMQKMIEIGTPGPMHEVLDPMAGTWNAEVKHWQDAAAEPQTSTGKSTSEWIYDGRYLETKFEGDMMGMPFEGSGVTGYDNFQEKHFSTWMDSMSTGFFLSEGSYDPATKTFTFTGKAPNCTFDGMATMRTIVKIEGPDEHVMEMHMPGPDGKEFKTMEIRYTRAK